MDKVDFSVNTKRGERREGLHGLNYNTNKQLTKEEKTKRHNKWLSNKNEKAAQNSSKKR